jgi:simple sugar transport system permease protein
VGLVKLSRPTLIGLASVAAALIAAYIGYGIWGFKTTSVLAFMIRYATPLVLAALCGTIGERTGVINIGIEGQMLMSAFTGFLVASSVGIFAGVVTGVLTGLAMGAFMALCAVTWRIDQVIAGTVVNILAAGLTSFFYRQGRTLKGQVPTIEIPGLADIPMLGRVLFQNPPITYLAIVLVGVLQIALFRTAWGLRTRAVGEHPSAADTVGVSVPLYRYRNVILAGALAGLAGAFISIEGTGSFERGMTAGRGFLALAIMIMGRWKPALAWAAALFFGFLNGLVNQLQFDRVIDIPPQFIGMLPYATTIVVLAVFAGRGRPPAAAGQPYTKE